MSNGHSSLDPAFPELRPWNEGLLLGAKRTLKPQQLWAILFWLDQHRRLRDRALFDFAIDSKLRGCDVVKVRIGDIAAGGRIKDRALVVQRKTKRPVQFELVEPARKTLLAWLERRGGTGAAIAGLVGAIGVWATLGLSAHRDAARDDRLCLVHSTPPESVLVT